VPEHGSKATAASANADVKRTARGHSPFRWRHRGEADKREVLLTLARKGENVLRKLSLQHLAELRVQGPALVTALERVTKYE